jgi:hypothetical protein
MAARDYWSHNTPDGQTPWSFITAAGYNYQTAGENLAYGFSTASDTVTGWMNSTEHRANILNGKFKELGVGVEPSTPSGDPTGATFTADFGARASNPVGVAKKPKPHRRAKHKHVKHKRIKHKRSGHKKHGGCSSTGNAAISLC